MLILDIDIVVLVISLNKNLLILYEFVNNNLKINKI